MTNACGRAHFRSGVQVAFNREGFMWGGVIVVGKFQPPPAEGG